MLEIICVSSENKKRWDWVVPSNKIDFLGLVFKTSFWLKYKIVFLKIIHLNY